jgi:DNA-binding NarL/FixJ family response regulator
MTSDGRPRVLLVDDNQDMLDRVAAMLSRACDVVGAVTDGAAAIEAVGTLRPDVIVLDLSMPGMSGFDVAGQLRASGLSAAIVFLSVYDTEEFVRAAQNAGGIGYVIKARVASDLMIAVMEAGAGRRYVSPLH